MLLTHRIRNGFSYIGVLFLVAILATATTMTVTLGAVMQRRLAEEELLFIGQQFRAAFKSYFEATPNGQRRYPQTLEDLVKDSRYPNPKRHLRKLFVDPITGKDDWIVVDAPGGGIMAVHSASEEHPIKLKEFDTGWNHLEDAKSYQEWLFGWPPPSLATK
jgi:type II secretory pathway pseudopilin PulG